MKKLLLLIFLIHVVVNCKAQVESNKLADTINSTLEKIEKKIDQKLLNIAETGNPSKSAPDSTIIFDSLHGKLIIVVKNLRNTNGNINVAMYDNYKSFANHSIPYRGASIAVTDNSLTIHFDSIPPGVYSIAAFHDEDKDGILRTNQLNIPVEGYCFSNNINAVMGVPEYRLIKFVYSGVNRKMVLNMTYLKFGK